mgnify:FL=1
MGSKRAINLLRQFGGDFLMENAHIRSTKDYVKVTATATLKASDSGKLHIVGPLAAGLAATTTVTLPTAADGLVFRFQYVGGAADAEDFIVVTGSDTNFYIGGLIQHDIGGEDGAAYHPNLSSHGKVTIKTPDAGTSITCVCDGTNWFINGWVSTATNTGVVFAGN